MNIKEYNAQMAARESAAQRRAAEPFELRVLLAKMKSAKAQGVNMSVWDSEIKAVADAIANIEAIRNLPINKSPPPQQ